MIKFNSFAKRICKAGLIFFFMLPSFSPVLAQSLGHFSDTKRSNAKSDYLAFAQWYRNHAVVDVFIQGESIEHLTSVLREIRALKQKDVLVRDIIVLGAKTHAHLNASTRNSLNNSLARSKVAAKVGELYFFPQLIKLANELALGNGTSVGNIAESAAELGVEQSPVWIITSRGERFVFEGYISLSNAFTSAGQFRRPELSGAQHDFRRRTAYHNKKAGGVPLFSTPQEDSAVSQFLAAFKYRFSDIEFKPGTGTSDHRPACSADRIRREPVEYYTDHLKEIDFLFYDPQVAGDRTRARKSSLHTVPYLEGDTYNPWREKPGLLQQYARYFDIRCLPTRLHFVYDGGRYFEEYREGKHAWD